ncbi:hypothetical protein [Sulfurovum sp. NBC37-1]|uniref:hypothetical protein n=1 Tax=Sulfurovum sp. (strain NBC37-1) TaxID=387093 RepID=UPI00015878AB|nr:hypothetical protein [Sulfurovum sp. NBC37-1]BAF71698.1 hypothetical protein SUN_0739 [Sulfurovum sp. NBC37-1]
MLKILLPLLFIFSLHASSIASIDDIKQAYRRINSQQASFVTMQQEIRDISSEGAVAKYFFDQDGSIALIKLNIYGEMGKLEEEYYFQNGNLFFMFSIDYSYNEPPILSGYDPKKTKIQKNRYYFIRDKMVKWLNTKLQKVPEYSAKFKNKEKEILHFMKQYLLAKVPNAHNQDFIKFLSLEDGSKVVLYYAEEEGFVTIMAKRFENDTLKWQKIIAKASPGAIEVGGIVGFSDSFIIAGHTTLSGSGKSYFWIKCFSKNGQSLWQKKTEASPQDTMISVLKLNKRFFETVTIEDEESESKYFITVYNKNGKQVLKKAFANLD